MLYFITATPGSGKTLYLINKLKDVTDRKIYYHGIPGLKLDWIELHDPVNYPDEITDGSIVVIDECSDHFPVRSAKMPTPLGVEFIRKHRHRGIDIYFITQHPTLLDHAARRLVGQHIHLQRNFGFDRAVMYENNKLFDPSNYHDLQACQKSQFVYPKECYDLYKSAEVHTISKRFPKILLLIPILLALIGFAVYFVYHQVLSKDEPVLNNSVPGSNVPSTNFIPGLTPRADSAINWATAFTPQIKGLPYTAPLYNKLAKPKVLPIVAGCISQGSNCNCYTQQGTYIDMSTQMCLSYLKHPVFNPFRDKKRRKQFTRGVQSSDSARFS